jgi:hypothetical protein
MITKDQFALNLRELKRKIPGKPKEYTQEYPKSIGEALSYYCNQRTVNAVQNCTKNFNDENWPLPLWFNLKKIQVGFWNKFYYKKQSNSWRRGTKFIGFKGFDFLWVPVLNNLIYKRSYDDALIEAFDANLKFAFQKFQSNPLLKPKRIILESIQRSYKNSDWIACISTTFPLIDFITRKILKTNKLATDVSRICKLFEQNGFALSNAGDLMPHVAFVSSYQPGQSIFDEERKRWFENMIEYDFGLVGPPLSSFVRFANIYYAYYKEDQVTEGESVLLNRHAILHGSIDHFGSKVNTIKLLTFFYLILELENVFEILFAE